MTDQADSVIQATDLVKDHCSQFLQTGKRTRVLDGLSLNVSKGQAFGLLGVNGAGKTTTLKCLLGLLKPNGGSISVLGLPAGDQKAQRRIGYLPENPSFYRHLTVKEVLDFFAQLFGMGSHQRRERIEKLLCLVKLQNDATTPVAALSKGMVQRLALAQCLLNDPDLILLDEPNSGLDPVGRQDMRNILQNLKSKGTTIFLNSHLLPDVNELCDRVAVLHGGKLVGEGETQEISSSGNYRELEEFFMEQISKHESVHDRR
jgi:ABC-2 type transport system ATP-binding protein